MLVASKWVPLIPVLVRIGDANAMDRAPEPLAYIKSPRNPVSIRDDFSDDDSSASGSSIATGGRRGSLRSRHTRASLQSKVQVEFNDVPHSLSLFEWSGGGRNVFLCGSWDNYTEKIPMESIQPGHFRCTVKVPQERLQFKYIVDGVEKFNPDYPTEFTEEGEKVNVKHVDPDKKKGPVGHIRKIVSKISGLDVYSPFAIGETVSMVLFRVFYILTVPAAFYYFYWLSVKGGNKRRAPVPWIVFIIAEMLSFLSAMIGLFGMWKPIKRKWRSLDQLKPPLAQADWPSVDICIAHYKEPPEQLRGTIRAALRLDYPAHLVRIIVADDGYFATLKSVERSQIGLDMYQMLAEEAGYDPLLEEVMNDQGLVEHYTVLADEEIVKPDSAKECHVFDFGPFGEDLYSPGALPQLTLIARVKPADHHNKAGNINNVLFNAGTTGKLILFLDADMCPNENMLLRMVPLMLEEMRDDSVERTLILNDDPEIGRDVNAAWRINRDVAFIQAPQRFHNVDKDDIMAARNSLFYDGIIKGRDGFGMTPFVGTNCLWRREVLFEINGFVYGSVTEDTLTSNEVHRRGYVSKYAAEDLAWGEAPVSVAAAMLQRQRWAKGAIMNGMKIFESAKDEQKRELIARRRGEIDEFYEYRRHGRRPNNGLVRAMFWLDSTLYPLLGVAAYMYMFVAIYYLITAHPPIDPKSIGDLASAFILYYMIRYIAFFSAYSDVAAVDILRGQETWFSYNICHVMGMWDAVMGAKMSWVANTGERNRRIWMEWVNISVVVIMVVGMIYRLTRFLYFEGGCDGWHTFGACCFGLYIASHMWPMVSISINERLNPGQSDDVVAEGYAVNTPILYSVATILAVLVLSQWATSKCGKLSSVQGT